MAIISLLSLCSSVLLHVKPNTVTVSAQCTWNLYAFIGMHHTLHHHIHMCFFMYISLGTQNRNNTTFVVMTMSQQNLQLSGCASEHCLCSHD